MSDITILQRLGMAIDRRYLKKVGATGIPGSKNQLLLICFHAYHGKTELDIHGAIIHPGDMVAEFHLSNKRIAEMGKEESPRSMEWRMLEMLKAEFASLAEACSKNIIPLQVEGFYGVNVLIAGAKRLGFALVPIPKGWNHWWLGFWESVLRKIFLFV